MVRISLYPLIAATRASPIPVLPLVGSMIAGTEPSGTLGVLNHGQRNAVLHASAGIEILYFCNYGSGKFLLCRILGQFKKRCAADKFCEVVGYSCHAVLCLCGFMEDNFSLMQR